jgi:hypothetical protein
MILLKIGTLLYILIFYSNSSVPQKKERILSHLYGEQQNFENHCLKYIKKARRSSVIYFPLSSTSAVSDKEVVQLQATLEPEQFITVCFVHD